MPAESMGTEDLLQRAGLVQGSALSLLLDRHRLRLRQTVAARLDRRIAARVDPSDIVQETLADAARRLPKYLRDRPMPYWAWLRRLAFQRVIRVAAVSFGIVESARSAHEWAIDRSWCDMPAVPIVDRLIDSGTSPSQIVVRDQERACVRNALETLAASDRQVLELRYVEDLSFDEIAATLDLGLSAVEDATPPRPETASRPARRQLRGPWHMSESAAYIGNRIAAGNGSTWTELPPSTQKASKRFASSCPQWSGGNIDRDILIEPHAATTVS